MRFRSLWPCQLLVAGLMLLALITSPVSARTTNGAADYVANEVVVKLGSLVDVVLVAASFGLDVRPISIDQLAGRPIFRLRIVDGTSPLRKVALLNNDPRVIFAEPNYVGQTPEAVARSSWAKGGDGGGYGAQWAPNKLRLPEAHQVSRGAGVTVAVLDTGVDPAHPALAGRLTPGFDFVGLDADPREEGVYGQDIAYGHGTHVAGLVALAAPEAKIMPLRILGPDGAGSSWVLAQALYYALNNNAEVINISYSLPRRSSLLEEVVADVTCAAPVLGDCRSSVWPGAVVAAAAGNSGTEQREYPAAAGGAGVLAVAASTEADTLAAFSTYGAWVQVAAPGEQIVSSVPLDSGSEYGVWSGTSMAAPLTAGVAALVRAANPGMSPSQVASRIIKRADAIDGQVRRRVDAAAALGVR